jgi:hypothetical protein
MTTRELLQQALRVIDEERYIPRAKIIEAIRAHLAKPEQEPFQIFNPVSPFGKVNVRDGDLPWVYDQDPSSGFKASMWVVPLFALKDQI